MRTPTNTGHGHVYPRPDGVKMRCGGPGLCSGCSHDLAEKQRDEQASAAMSDSKATTAEPVAWRLIAPDGREFNGTSPINCAKKALDATVTKTQQAENFWSAFEETAREIKPSPLLTRTWSA